ncbi:MAG: hypothetical protein D8M61_20975 [Ignavibacteriae bacterium]|nr:hypothetical protein [Ignavibacteriota bacterium]
MHRMVAVQKAWRSAKALRWKAGSRLPLFSFAILVVMHTCMKSQPNQGINLTAYSALFRCAGIFTPPKRTVIGRLSLRYMAKWEFAVVQDAIESQLLSAE